MFCFSTEAYHDHLLAHTLSNIEDGPSTASNNLNDSLLAKVTQEEEDGSIKNGSNSLESDGLLAQRLQYVERKKKEEKEFKKLQEMYGMDNKGSYSKQFEKKMDRQVGRNVSVTDYFTRKANMHSEMMLGVDSYETRTPGIIEALKHQNISGNIKSRCLCNSTDHFSAAVGDSGWGCGYRNLQMLLSAISKNELYGNKLKEKFKNDEIPSVTKLQALIEEAWKDGFDKAGCEQLGGKLHGTRKWIGTTEVVALLRWAKINARIVDFHKPTSPENTHVRLFEWADSYFKQRKKETTLPPFPLYLQHQGHSRLCIGCEEVDKADFKTQLLLFDPGHKYHAMRTLLANLNDHSKIPQLRMLRKTLKQMKSKQFQIIFIDGLYETEVDVEAGKVIRSIRIP